MCGCVDPWINGPFHTIEKRNEAMEEHKKGNKREHEDIYFEFTITKGAEINLE